MHPLTTNICALTRDVHRFRFESAGVLEIANEYSGIAASPAHLYCLRRSQASIPHTIKFTQWRSTMGLSQLDSFAVYVGIDWALSKHDVCIHVPGEQTRRFETIPHQVEDIDLWVRSLKRRHGGPIAVAIELSKGPIISILEKYDFIVLFPINPLTLAKYRTAFKPSRAKDDPTDAELAIDLLCVTLINLRHCSHKVQKCACWLP